MGGTALASLWHTSGPLAIVVAGLIVGDKGREKGMSDLTREYVDKFWEMLDEILNAVLFVLIGLEMLVLDISNKVLLVGVVCIFLTLLARLISVALPLSLLKRYSDFNAPTLRVLVWGGLRGGISVALALSLPITMPRDLIVGATYVVVVFSIIVQGLTIGPLVKKTGPKHRRRARNALIGFWLLAVSEINESHQPTASSQQPSEANSQKLKNGSIRYRRRARLLPHVAGGAHALAAGRRVAGAGRRLGGPGPVCAGMRAAGPRAGSGPPRPDGVSARQPRTRNAPPLRGAGGPTRAGSGGVATRACSSTRAAPHLLREHLLWLAARPLCWENEYVHHQPRRLCQYAHAAGTRRPRRRALAARPTAQSGSAAGGGPHAHPRRRKLFSTPYPIRSTSIPVPTWGNI